jgi:hypothetical protein
MVLRSGDEEESGGVGGGRRCREGIGYGFSSFCP